MIIPRAIYWDCALWTGQKTFGVYNTKASVLSQKPLHLPEKEARREMRAFYERADVLNRG